MNGKKPHIFGENIINCRDFSWTSDQKLKLILRSHVQISLLELYKPGHQLPQSEEVE